MANPVTALPVVRIVTPALATPVLKLIPVPELMLRVPVIEAAPTRETAFSPLMVMLEAPEAKEILGPATSETLLEVPFNAKLVAAAGAGTEMVTLPAPTPTLAMPAPEKFNRLLNVPAFELVVLPSAV